MLTKGRRKITFDCTVEEMSNLETIIAVINSAMVIHSFNREEIIYLIDYHNGKQPILDKDKPIRPEINNKLVINHAQMITRMINGYFLGTPIQYTANGFTDKKDKIDVLNKYVEYEDKSSVDKELGEMQSICGTAYRMIYTDGLYGDEVPFEDKSLFPANTFVVYEQSIAERPLLGVTYQYLVGEDMKFDGIKFYAYTPFGYYEFLTNGNSKVKADDLVVFNQYNVGGVPIIEYPNNMWRLGDWELCIDLMDAINNLQSGRLDDIDQIVQSLLVFINAEVDADVYEQMRNCGVISLVNKTNNQSDVKTVSTSLDQNGMSLYSQELEELLYALIGIPNRNNRASGGGDTGQAVELRDGWADLEIVARNKESVFKKSEKQALKIILTILNNKTGIGLSMLDVDIKFSRNKNNNLLVKTQSYVNLLSTKTLSPYDCLSIVDLVSDVNEYVSRGQAFWGESFANNQPSEPIVEESEKSEENVNPEDKDSKPIE